MATEVGLRTSFFDDDDLSITFTFIAPDKTVAKDLNTPAIVKGSLLKKLNNSPLMDPGHYSLHNRILAYHKSEDSKPELVLNLAQSRLKILSEKHDTVHAFAVTKNGETYEFHCKDAATLNTWTSALRYQCVLTTFHDEYKALKMIGKGSFAKVYLVESKANGKSFAVKAFTKEGVIASNKNNAKPSMINEIDIMRGLDHDNIIKLYEVYETEKSLYLVLDLIQGKSLQDTLKKSSFRDEYTEVKIFNIIRAILDALAYLAAKGIMHRDLKPDNILLEDGEKVKIVDFGLATFVDVPEYIFKKCGTPGYIAPEVFKYDQKDPSTNYCEACDVFSAGAIFYFLLHAKAFFEGTNGSEILRSNRKFVPEYAPLTGIKKSLERPEKFSKDSLELLLKLLEFNQNKRISAAEALTHPYFTPFPLGMTRVSGSNEFTSQSIHKYNQHGNYSPKVSSPYNHSPENLHPDSFYDKIKTDAFDKNSPSPGIKVKERFAEKGSLYLDMGKPEVNGKVDTLTSGGSTNNSMLLNKREVDSIHSGLPSSFSKNALNSSDQKNKQGKGYKVHGAGNQSVLKAAIFRNMQKNSENPGEDNEGPNSAREERRASDGVPQKRYSLMVTTKYASAGQDDMQISPSDEYSASFDNSQNGNDSFHRQPSSPLRRFQPFAPKK